MVLAPHVHAAHVAQVEQTRRAAHAARLVEDGAVLHGHVPTAELDQLGPEGGVDVVQGGLLHRWERARVGGERGGRGRIFRAAPAWDRGARL